jgi:CubicO group peptidase (beta-lactamase class C family)
VIWSRGYGKADLENDVPARADTKYRSASIGKCITATAAMRLFEQHKLDLDRPIQDYCEAFPRKPWTITTRHLLSHQSGIRHYGGPRDREEQTSVVHYASVADALAPFKDDPLLFEPGTNHSYSTYGYDVVGCVLEGATGMRFMDVIRSHVFEPCGMADSRDDDPAAIIPGRAAGYARVDGELRIATHVDMSNRLPAGGYLTTAPDLARFAAKFLDGGLVTRETRDAMLTEQVLKNGDTVNYGLGWGIIEDAAGHADGTAFHGGSSPGASGMLFIDPKEHLGVVFLSNLENAPARLETARALARIVLESAQTH